MKKIQVRDVQYVKKNKGRVKHVPTKTSFAIQSLNLKVNVATVYASDKVKHNVIVLYKQTNVQAMCQIPLI